MIEEMMDKKRNPYDFRSLEEFKEFCKTLKITPEITKTLNKLADALRPVELLISDLQSFEFLSNKERLKKMRYSRNYKGLDHNTRWQWKLKSLKNLENKYNKLVDAFNLFHSFFYELLLLQEEYGGDKK